jgi:O-antigen ligase/polysaccharide polymerase Wzy-like membrane protein
VDTGVKLLGGRIDRFQRGETTSMSNEWGLESTTVNLAVVSLVVASLFMQRFELVEGAGTYPVLPIPDLFFVSAIALLTAKAALDKVRLGTPLRPFGRKDVVVIGFIALLGALSILAVLLNDASLTSRIQVAKTVAHLVVLGWAALLLGRTLSTALVAFALKVYFALAVAVSGLAIVQAADQNLASSRLSDALHLVTRTTGDFARPCSIFSEPAYLGYAALAGVMIGLGVIADRHPILAAAGSAVCAAALLLAAAAGPLGVGACVALYGLLMRRRLFSRNAAPAFGTVAVVATLIWFLTPVNETVLTRAEAISKTVSEQTIDGSRDNGAASDSNSGRTDPSADLRAELNRASIQVWKKAPVTGVGLGNSRRQLSEFVEVSFLPDAAYPFNTSNAYVNLLGESGPLGVVGLVGLLSFLWLRNHGSPERLEEVTRAFIVLLAVSFLVTNPLIMPPLWFWAGIRLSLQQGNQ